MEHASDSGADGMAGPTGESVDTSYSSWMGESELARRDAVKARKAARKEAAKERLLETQAARKPRA
jgi:hypothetical protein